MYPPMTFLHPDLTYNRDTDAYEVMPTESERKDKLIQEINTIQLQIGKGPVDPDQFEILMRCTIETLQRFVSDQATTLERANAHL